MVAVCRSVVPFRESPEFLVYKKLHPSTETPNPRHMLETLQLETLCDKTCVSLPKGRTLLSTLQSQLGDALIGIHVQGSMRYRLLADEHVLLQGQATAEPTLFITPTTPSMFFYTSQAVENPAGLTILTEAVPLYALQNTQIAIELSEDSEVDLYTVYYPQPLLDATRTKRGKLQLQGHAWLYDPATPANEIAFFPDLPF
jgi:hypothetical protein